MNRPGLRRMALGALLPVALTGIVACTTAPGGVPGAAAAPPSGVVQISRTANGVAHIVAADPETLAYGVAYAHAQDNVCQTAEALVTARAERARYFGAKAIGQLGLRALPNDQIDLFIQAFIDDEAVARAAAQSSAEANAMARGYVAGYNRYLADHAADLPAACAGKAWVTPMTQAEYQRGSEIGAIQLGMGLFADAILGARPPSAKASAAQMPEPALTVADLGLQEQPVSSNAWAFGRDSTADGRGLLLGNPHFPWKGTNRFWQMHVTIPGSLDVMGVAIGTSPVVVIGFNKDVAWSHTVSTGKRFTLHELKLVDGDPTRYVVDGRAEKMTSRQIAGTTLWSTRYGPVIQAPRMGLNWTDKVAFALQDANRNNVRGLDQWLQYGRARSVADIRNALRNLGTAWVNTIAADRDGQALYADGSVVPDVDAAQLERCTPLDEAARRLRQNTGMVVLDGSRSDCDWRRDPASRVPGITPIERLPVAVRSDWVMNSNDSFVYTNPAQRFDGISPLVGTARVDNPRTRSSLIEIPAMLAAGPGGKATPEGIERELFGNRNLLAEQVLPDLLAACARVNDAMAEAAALREGCAALGAWDRRSNAGSRGAHLFREFWRQAQWLPKVYREPFDPQRPVATPTGLNMTDAAVAGKVWESLAKAVKMVRDAGFALDAPLGSVQRPGTVDEPIALHGGEPFEGVLNMQTVTSGAPGLSAGGYRIDFGTSYVQVVGFDARGPRAQALLTYGQSSDPSSPHAADQLRLFSAKQWPRLPFYPEDVARERVGPVLALRRER
ncbi:MAG TPA: penicillin acylase family protein [Burkholderiaceae bacterium]|nr:penicillin acylase family protein [Burkholderiaceae bacterium]